MEQVHPSVPASAGTSRHPAIAAPLVAIGFAVAAALLLGIADLIVGGDGSDALFAITAIGGWVLLGWAGIIAVGCAVRVVGSVRQHGGVSRVEVILIGAGLVLIVLVLLAHPLWGSGSAGA
ncbi:hypothetical protein [Naasia lichenicola]|uniref:Uncharacterized protein n=1 Tax=Naasia lichenicola TaxID=2565933 RepID=A0A4S4FGD6_9MICO|nr:hypothetical protein [Naasia lichenicola]THG29273.1 hypothetical protein E6C64_11115 [Naasia lichenicola]